MTTITLKEKPIHTIGELPAVGNIAPNFTLTKTNLSDFALKEVLGKNLVLNIFPSVDTDVCANSVRRFNQIAADVKDNLIICISADLPFAQKRFCGAEGLDRVMMGSVFRHPEFGKNYGVLLSDGPLAGLLSRAIVIIDPQGKVKYTQQVKEISNEPDYSAALAALK